MAPTLKDDLGNIGSLIIRKADERFTGKITININMRKGGIGSIKTLIEQNLKIMEKT